MERTTERGEITWNYDHERSALEGDQLDEIDLDVKNYSLNKLHLLEILTFDVLTMTESNFYSYYRCERGILRFDFGCKR